MDRESTTVPHTARSTGLRVVRGTKVEVMTMGWFKNIKDRLLGPPNSVPRTYDDYFLDLRERVTEERLMDTEMLDSVQDDAKTHMLLALQGARQCAATDPLRAQQHMRLALTQGQVLETVAQERYQTSCRSLDSSLKAIAQAAQASRKALPIHRKVARAIEGADVMPVAKTPAPSQAPVQRPATHSTKPRFDTDYEPSGNGKQ